MMKFYKYTGFRQLSDTNKLIYLMQYNANGFG